MPSGSSSRRQQALQAEGALHPHPKKVSDPLFRESAFFDPHDVVQVKYEMLRRVRVEAESASRAAAAFGFSRPAFYQAREVFEREGLPGLLPRKRGPRGPHKLTDAIVAVLATQTDREGAPLRAPALAQYLRDEFGITAHPRSIERSLARFRARQEKKTLSDGTRSGLSDDAHVTTRALDPAAFTAAYERLRACVMGEGPGGASQGRRAAGLGLVLQRGLPGWMAGDAALQRTGSSSPAVATGGDPVAASVQARLGDARVDLAPGALPPAQRPELVRLIAGLVLSTRWTPRAPWVGRWGADTPGPGGVACR